MRVLHVIATGQPRGAEIFASELVGSLTSSGLEQHVVALRADNGVMVPFAAPVTALDSARDRRVPGLRLDLRSVRFLRDLARRWQPDIIQAHGGEALKHCVLLKARGGAAVVYRRIGSVPPWVGGRARRAVHGRIMKRATKVVALAEVLRRQTIDVYGLSPDRVVTIPMGVDPKRLEPTAPRDELRKALGIRPDAKVILSLGALTKEKDPLNHIEVSSRVFREIPEAIHLIAGDGPLRSQVERAALGDRSAGRVSVLGNRADVADLLAVSDVMILASHTEGVPGCLIEAGMAGLVTAAYSVGAVPEVVRHGHTGLLVSAGDLDGLTSSVIRLLSEDELRSSLGREARGWCLPRFDSRRVSQDYLQLYREVTSAHLEV